MWIELVRDWTRRLDNPRAALSVVVGLTLSLAVLSGPARLRAASSVVALWSAVSPSFGGLGGAREFADTTAASTGFTSVPTVRALLKAPRWIAAANKTGGAVEAQAAPKDRSALAVVGLPVDVEHAMLSTSKVESFCVGPDRAEQGTFSLCKDAKQIYGGIADCQAPKNSTEENLCLEDDEHLASGVQYNLCDFDEDCWHSTAVAIVAGGSQMQPSIFALPGEQASADFHDDTFLHLARADYEEFVSDGDEKKTTFKEFLGKRFPGFGDILNVTMPIAVIPYGGYATKKAYITRQMIFDRGVHAGGPLLAVNVFSRFESAVECDAHHKGTPCVLTTMAAQQEALRHMLSDFAGPKSQSSPGSTHPSLGAIVIVAGGELTGRRCDDTAMAKLIGELRRHGVLTFVPVGNDGDATKVRFPACASEAVSIGSLTRDGAIAAFSNGSKTGMVALYVDGETIVLPIRGPRFLNDTGTGMLHPREPTDQYDAYLAGGTLLSAAVASGVFLNLRERYPTVPTEAIVSALKANRSSARPAFSEVNEQAAERMLAGHEGQH